MQSDVVTNSRLLTWAFFTSQAYATTKAQTRERGNPVAFLGVVPVSPTAHGFNENVYIGLWILLGIVAFIVLEKCVNCVDQMGADTEVGLPPPHPIVTSLLGLPSQCTAKCGVCWCCGPAASRRRYTACHIRALVKASHNQRATTNQLTYHHSHR